MVRVLVLLISVCLFTAVASAQRGDDILLLAGRFVQDTSASLSGVIADETYEQEVSAQYVIPGIKQYNSVSGQTTKETASYADFRRLAPRCAS